MDYKLTVIIPTYNAEDYLLDAVNSVQKQSIGFENIELILVDDNSCDNTKTMLKKLSREYENVKIFFLENNTGSASEPRNIGIKESTTNYIMFLDSDDKYLPDMCEVMYNTISEYDGEMVSCRFYQEIDGKIKVPHYFLEDFNHEKFNEFKGNYFENRLFVNKLDDFPDLLTLGYHSMTWNKIFKKEMLLNNDIYFPIGAFYEDVYFTSKVLLNAENMVFLTKFFGYSYQIRHNEKSSVCQNFSQSMVEKQLDGFLTTMNLINGSRNNERFKSELIVDMTKIYIYSQDLDKKFENEFLNYMKSYYKEYNLFIRINTAKLVLNLIINLAIKIFSLNNKFIRFASHLYSKFQSY